MPGLFNRLKTWIFEEVVKAKDLNGEFDNIINHLETRYIAGANTLAGFQNEIDPGGLGTEVIPNNDQDQIDEIKFAIARIIGNGLLWYQSPSISLADANSLLALGIGIPPNRIVSGRKRAAPSNQALFLQADGTLPKVTLKAGGLNPDFSVFIEDVNYVFTTDILFTSLSLAPSINNTAAVYSGILGDKYIGEVDSSLVSTTFGSKIAINTVGTEISARVGSYAAFKFTDGSDEYFFAFIEDASTLSIGKRGFFFDNTDAPVVRQLLTGGSDTLTLLKLSWIFITTAGMLDVTYTNPAVSVSAPTSPSPGDYWFDLVNNKWMKFNGAIFVNALAMLIGLTIQDTTKCIGTRSFEFFAGFSKLNEVVLNLYSSTEIRSIREGCKVSVDGNLIDFNKVFTIWNSTLNMAPSLTIQPNTQYYLYISERGDSYIDVERPYDRRQDLLGYYHPYQMWRAVGQVITDGSSNFGNPIYSADDTIVSPFNLAPKPFTFPTALAGQVVQTPSCGTFSTTSTSFTPVTNLSGTIISAAGRPIKLAIMSDSTGANSYITVGDNGIAIRITDGSFGIEYGRWFANTASSSHLLPFYGEVLDGNLSAGQTRTYKVSILNSSGASGVTMANFRLYIYEI